ncbi:serine hydrolase domain-containing protein [Nocardia lijiangensis]|uniref:serine hydrolase domain-containing protein n=1 Tax=Nocardia lijiangensis TaxID=299618 RepID=UPI003D73A91D
MRLIPILAAVSTAALLVAGCANDNETGSQGVSDARLHAVQEDIDRVVGAGVTGAIATVTENGETAVRTAGVADLESSAPIPAQPPQRTRVGSVTKSFTSALVLQLVAEGKVRLDEPVDTYLPGLLRGDGIDGRAITVRQILRHQSGLPDFAGDPRADVYRAGIENRTMTPAEGIAMINSARAVFAPGERYQYSNTNYLVAGMLIERVTGAPYAEELDRRILKPLGLTDTYLPGPGERDIRGPHPAGYATLDGVVTDVSRIEPSIPWAAGALVSSGADLNRFYGALLAGRVLAAAELEQMRAGVPIDPESGMVYGLGLASMRLPCGAEYIGHDGGIDGYYTLSGATVDGRAVSVAMTKAPETEPDLIGVLEHALCP